jgi:hypothetical protein
MSNNPEMTSNRGRPPNPQPTERIHVAIPTNVSVYYRMKFFDDLTQQMKKGELSKLIVRLLKEEAAKEGVIL